MDVHSDFLHMLSHNTQEHQSLDLLAPHTRQLPSHSCLMVPLTTCLHHLPSPPALTTCPHHLLSPPTLTTCRQLTQFSNELQVAASILGPIPITNDPGVRQSDSEAFPVPVRSNCGQ